MSAPRVRTFDAAAEAARDGADLERAAIDVIASGRYILGPEVTAFEHEIAGYLGDGVHAVACASGTDALWLALRALGVGPGDGVVLPAFTFFATASAVLTAGATPVLCDVLPDTMNMDPDALDDILCGRSKVGGHSHVDPATIKAVLPVHLFGQPADMSRILATAQRRGVDVVEDAAQAFGATFAGAQVGTLGAAGCFSFFPTKNLGGLGDGGLVSTRDPALADRLRALRAHGSQGRYVHNLVGTNSRLDALQAAMLRVRLRTIDERLADRASLADRYDAALGDGDPRIPVRAPGRSHSFNLYVVRIRHRDAVARALGERGIETAVHYPSPLHHQLALASLGYTDHDFPNAEDACREVLTIPLYPSLDPASVDVVAGELLEAVDAVHAGRAR